MKEAVKMMEGMDIPGLELPGMESDDDSGTVMGAYNSLVNIMANPKSAPPGYSGKLVFGISGKYTKFN